MTYDEMMMAMRRPTSLGLPQEVVEGVPLPEGVGDIRVSHRERPTPTGEEVEESAPQEDSRQTDAYRQWAEAGLDPEDLAQHLEWLRQQPNYVEPQSERDARVEEQRMARVANQARRVGSDRERWEATRSRRRGLTPDSQLPAYHMDNESYRAVDAPRHLGNVSAPERATIENMSELHGGPIPRGMLSSKLLKTLETNRALTHRLWAEGTISDEVYADIVPEREHMHLYRSRPIY
jgi:hypothetical protein